MEGAIQLRGHHLAVFANYARGIGRDSQFLRGYTMISLGGEVVEKSDNSNFWESLLQNPNQEVELLAGSDTICKRDCPWSVQATCATREGDEDDLTLRAYGFQPGERPTIKTILDRVDMYHAQTGFYSPRNKLFWIR